LGAILENIRIGLVALDRLPCTTRVPSYDRIQRLHVGMSTYSDLDTEFKWYCPEVRMPSCRGKTNFLDLACIDLSEGTHAKFLP
jgi:hypothetical protein